jgi:hypothetical protein
MADLTVPAGSSEGVFAAAARLRTLAERTESVRADFGAQAAAVVQALTVPRSAEAAEAAGTVSTRLEASARQTSLGAEALHDYGMALAAGVEVVHRSSREWQRHDDGIRTWR